ncbi:hypothetical protein KSP40_PGU004032 [Platanthera guangdongensis]|uniref:Uncharacterized protein n=1 Tax=Platanthera guangdongensis TaxID=2320717 RepID=A0ABR2LZS1_9ASPA
MGKKCKDKEPAAPVIEKVLSPVPSPRILPASSEAQDSPDDSSSLSRRSVSSKAVMDILVSSEQEDNPSDQNCPEGVCQNAIEKLPENIEALMARGGLVPSSPPRREHHGSLEAVGSWRSARGGGGSAGQGGSRSATDQGGRYADWKAEGAADPDQAMVPFISKGLTGQDASWASMVEAEDQKQSDSGMPNSALAVYDTFMDPAESPAAWRLLEGTSPGLSPKQSAALICKLKELNRKLGCLNTWWPQRAKVRWLTEGDSNTAYFRTMGSNRRQSNQINQVLDLNDWTYGLASSQKSQNKKIRNCRTVHGFEKRYPKNFQITLKQTQIFRLCMEKRQEGVGMGEGRWSSPSLLEGDSEGRGDDLVVNGASGLGLEAGLVNPTGLSGGNGFSGKFEACYKTSVLSNPTWRIPQAKCSGGFFNGSEVDSGAISLGTPSVKLPAKSPASSPALLVPGGNGVAAARVLSSSKSVVDPVLPLAAATLTTCGDMVGSPSMSAMDLCRSSADGGGSAFAGTGGSPPAASSTRSRLLGSGSGSSGPDLGGSGLHCNGSRASVSRSGDSSMAQVRNGNCGGSTFEVSMATVDLAGLAQNDVDLEQEGIPLTPWESLNVCGGDVVNVVSGIDPRVLEGSLPCGGFVSGAVQYSGGKPRVFRGSPPPTAAGTSLGMVGVNNVMGVAFIIAGGISRAPITTPIQADSSGIQVEAMEEEPDLDDAELDAMEEAFNPLAGGDESERMGSHVGCSVDGNIDCNAVLGFGALPDVTTARGVLEDGPLTEEVDMGLDTEPVSVGSVPPDVPVVPLADNIGSGNVQPSLLDPVLEHSISLAFCSGCCWWCVALALPRCSGVLWIFWEPATGKETHPEHGIKRGRIPSGRRGLDKERSRPEEFTIFPSPRLPGLIKSPFFQVPEHPSPRTSKSIPSPFNSTMVEDPLAAVWAQRPVAGVAGGARRWRYLAAAVSCEFFGSPLQVFFSPSC